MQPLPWPRQRPIFVDHGTPIGGGLPEGWAAGRWAGFSSTFLSRTGHLPAWLPIKEATPGWDSSFNVRVAMQQTLSSTLLGNGTTADPRCRYDGIFAAGRTSLLQVAHWLELHNCWGVASDGTPPFVASVDDNAIARELLAQSKEPV